MTDRYDMLFEAVDAAFGRTEWTDRRSTVEFDGGPLLLSLEYAGRGMGRPLRMLRPTTAASAVSLIVARREGFHYSGVLPEILTGDAIFDDTVFVAGRPPDVARAVLDEQTRQWLLSDAAGWSHHVTFNEQGLSSVRDVPSTMEIAAGRARVTAADLNDRANGLSRLARRLTDEYNSAHAVEASRSGHDGAARWHSNNEQAVVAHRASRDKRARRVGCIIAVVLLLLVVGGPVAWIYLTL